jgi:hypothetical protein
MTTRQIYFICSTPGTSGNFIGRLVRSLIDEHRLELNQHIFDQQSPETLTSEFFYSNITIPEEGNAVVHVPFRPDYDTLTSRFPGCKIIVMTHQLQECDSLAKRFFQSYYIDAYEYGAEPNFRKIIQNHLHLFSNSEVLPWEFTKKERSMFVRILSYHKLLDGFHSLLIPDRPDVLEVTFRDLYFNPSLTQTKIEQFTGIAFSQAQKDSMALLIENFTSRFFNPAIPD